MLGDRGSHHGNKFYPQARPFDEFLIGNPTGNTGSIIYSNGSSDYPSQQQQPYFQQQNVSPGRLPQTTFQITTIPYPTVFHK
jgi:hypothetical protein